MIWRVIKWTFATIGVMLAALLLIILGMYAYYEWFYQEWSPARIERITGVDIPECELGPPNNMHIYAYDDFRIHSILFKSVPRENTFIEIDRRIAEGCKEWKKEGDKYIYSVTWGKGYSTPTPKGEKDAEYATFSFEITRGSKKGRLEYIYDSIK